MKLSVPIFTAILLLLNACGNDATGGTQISETGSESDTAAVTEAPKYVLPAHDFNNESFLVYAGEGYNESFAEEEIGEPLNDAKYHMVRTVEEALHVDIDEFIVPFWGMNDEIRKLVMSGDTTYDSFATMDMYALPLAREGCFLSMQNVDTIQLDQPWWGGDIADQLSIAENLFYAPAPINLWGYRQTACMLMNISLAESLGVAVPYDDVFAGSWTVDDLLALQGVATKDLNGDGIMDAADQYTYGVSDIRRYVEFIWSGCDGRFIEKDENDIPYLTVIGSEKYVDVVNMCYNMVYSGPDKVTQYVNTEDASGANLSNFAEFCDGKILITTSFVGHLLDNNLRDMKDDFAVLPMPKYDESQENYRSWGDDPTFYMIPVTQDDVTFSGTVLDALACTAYYDLLPVLIDTALKDKMSRNEESKQVIQICFDNRFCDIGEFAMDQYFYVHDKLMKGVDTVVSSIEKQRKRIEKELEAITELFLNASDT